MSKTTSNPPLTVNVENTNTPQDVKLESSTEYELIPDPPDGGYGWVILVATVLQNFICQR